MERDKNARSIEASWRNGYAEDCKSLHPGSIPGEASRPAYAGGRTAHRDPLALERADKDSPLMGIDFSQARIKMVDGQVRTTDVTNLALLDAFLEVPREQFVPAERRVLAYIDEDIQIAPAQAGGLPRYLMEASPLAKLLRTPVPAMQFNP